MTKGKISRAKYLSTSLSSRAPWIAEGISRRTWERRRRLHARDASPQAASPEQGAVASPDDDTRRLEEARAGVEAIYRQMEAERERRWQWWTQPIEDLPDRIEMRSILSGQTVTIRLDGGGRDRRKQAAPIPRPWWDDDPRCEGAG